MPRVLEVKRFSARIGEKEILHNVSLAVSLGEVHFLMGPNGSGKTTLAGALMGDPAITATAGTIVYGGEDITAFPPEERAKKGLYLGFQYPVEIPGVGCVAFLRSVLAARGTALPSEADFRAELTAAGGELGVSAALLDRNLNEGFSGGEKKRSEILQLHVLKPTLAILDEFDSGLDVDGVRAVCESLNNWMSKERALIVITHTGRVSEFLKPHAVHIMKDGAIARRGGPELVREIEQAGFESLV